ncbi:MAG: hypothetical protein JKX70_06215 [Phycisphaerales bacterium]|nr:hypothetical protein [Phycisphaerales bacterium]
MPDQSRPIIFMYLSIAACVLGLWASIGFAQQDSSDAGEVQLSVASFGVGGLAREGDWAGIQVQLLDLGSSGRDIVLRLAIRDEDGDETQYDRVVTANPGVKQSFWLYCWIPHRGSGIEYELKAYEAIDSGNTDVGEFGFKVGRMLGQLPIYNPQIQVSSIGLAGIVGNNQLSLDQYGYTTGGRLAMLFGHELLRVSPGLGVENLPDRWQGLASMDTLVWSNASTATTSPGRLSPEKARAIRTWIERGGHLVIVLPSSGEPWYLGNHPLRTILPEIASPKRKEGVDLDDYRELLTESKTVVLPKNAVVYTFEPLADKPASSAMAILNDRDGAAVVIRRLMGSGMVTVVGLPLNHGQLRRVGLPEPEAFWHRVLGMRGNILRPDQMTDQQKTDTGNRTALVFDEGISGAIAKTGRAVQGVFFGIVVFILYWIVAGPGGYAMLRAKKKKHHAWVVFVATTGVFTALAWVGATMMRPKSVNISHLSMLEEVYGQDSQRARTWLSVMLPSYGSAVVSMRDPEDSDSFVVQESTNLLSPWSAPNTIGGFAQGFPDNSGYRVESKNPSAIRVPTRATVKSFLAEWSGESGWSMPKPVGVPGAIEEPKLTVSGTTVTGQVVHELPGALHDVRVFVITGEVPILRVGQSLNRRMIAQTAVYVPSFGEDGWTPGQVLNLEPATQDFGSRQGNYFRTVVSHGVDLSGLGRGSKKLTDRLMAGRFISQFEPPNFEGAANDPVGSRLAVRKSLHGWDLGRWFTEPTLIIMGVVDIDKDEANADGMPTPIWVNGKKVPASGKTIVTWIYPFDADPPEFLDKARAGTE